MKEVMGRDAEESEGRGGRGVPGKQKPSTLPTGTSATLCGPCRIHPNPRPSAKTEKGEEEEAKHKQLPLRLSPDLKNFLALPAATSSPKAASASAVTGPSNLNFLPPALSKPTTCRGITAGRREVGVVRWGKLDPGRAGRSSESHRGPRRSVEGRQKQMDNHTTALRMPTPCAVIKQPLKAALSLYSIYSTCVSVLSLSRPK
jgi:hypothetical protein